MNLLKFLSSKIFLMNLFAAIILLVVIGWAILKFLDFYTLHGETVTVPEVIGYQVNELDEMLEEKGLRYTIVDSVYFSDYKSGAVVDQDPKPDLQVKIDRMLYLTINATEPPKVQMPNLVDFSLRQAMAIIESSGLKVGNLKYVPDFAHNAVLSQEFKGKQIKPGETIIKGSTIDLLLGQGLSEELVAVPQLVNLSYNEAIEALYAASLNPGSVIKDATVKDSTLARVYRQVPEYIDEKSMINIGASVDIYITQSPDKAAGSIND